MFGSEAPFLAKGIIPNEKYEDVLYIYTYTLNTHTHIYIYIYVSMISILIRLYPLADKH
jgi:hypothetical protein